jgi:hypothetical protein
MEPYTSRQTSHRATQALPLVRASDIGTWAFCQRAWWLAQVKGVAHERPHLLAQGGAAHQAHGRLMSRANRLYTVALALIATVLLLIGFTLLFWLAWYG